ncbi:hypothetical protein [Flavobacterium nitrogenifigens]|uniref:hypothetical protein n=1 Tax=Flavobacterium nitrogenifigens TaxID=1617283 RepID=UPI001158C8F2|nr:hypothetical protein [Flavobacterium nitrogenifigens]KAF2333332.1 hypothetical protein DM397_09305 [Flavobacterium nitrogenifigens]
MTAQTKTVVTQHGEKVQFDPNSIGSADNGLTALNKNVQLGGELNKRTTIKASTTNTIAISGLTSSNNTSDTPVVATADGTLKKGAFPMINILPDDIGTVIAIDGKLEVAQEISAMITANLNIAGTTGNIPTPLGGMTKVFIDNRHTFYSDSNTNYFTIKTTGIYAVNINVPVTPSAASTPAVGVWCNTDNKWVARVNLDAVQKVPLTLMTSITLDASKTYSFRVINTVDLLVEALNYGTSGTGPVGFFSIKRLK